ncbi:MAG: DegT/DnrJ/EryC1/StrS family aminotransferase [Acidobacteriota bacterium]
MTASSSLLAILGGIPVRSLSWPNWPRAEQSTEEALLKVLRSQRWTISGPCLEDLPFERQFAESFAAFHEVPYCVPTANGSSALTIALEALGIGPGREVLVPGLTWVACGSSVARLGGIPILVDVDPDTLCMSVNAARNAITRATAAIMLVHLYCTVADLASFQELSSTTGIPLIEDCSHAHGASWQGRKVGTFGAAGVFSMQQSKVLASGEGGAVITKDANLYSLLQQFRADGRRYVARRIPRGLELEPAGDVQGHNHCLSEFHAAILHDRLRFLDEENAIRTENASHLTSRLREISGVRPLHKPEAAGRPTFYRYCLEFQLERFGCVPIETVAAALTAELGLTIQPLYDPLNQNQLFNPMRSPRRHQATGPSPFEPSRFHLPTAVAARRRYIAIPHNALLGGLAEIEDIVRAVEKVMHYWHQLENASVPSEANSCLEDNLSSPREVGSA